MFVCISLLFIDTNIHSHSPTHVRYYVRTTQSFLFRFISFCYCNRMHYIRRVERIQEQQQQLQQTYTLHVQNNSLLLLKVECQQWHHSLGKRLYIHTLYGCEFISFYFILFFLCVRACKLFFAL